MPGRINIRRHLILFLALLLLWLLLNGSLANEEMVAGAVVAFAVSLISAPYLSILQGFRCTPTAILAIFLYLGYFFVALIRANFDMARRVLSPSLPISPQVVEIETRLNSELGRMLLANSITLTPGTLTVDLLDNRLLVHWIAAPAGVEIESATREIASGFERHIGRFLE
jgi:multicomponent Na+:H+ antiporter subunit E